VRWKGIQYDAGLFLGINWRPVFDPPIVRRELEVIHRDLHANAVAILGRSPRRLEFAAEAALEEGLTVWLSPRLWDREAATTARYVRRVARRCRPLADRWPDRFVLSVAAELTLFGRGIVPGRSLAERLANPALPALVGGGATRAPLDAFLRRLVAEARAEYPGPLAYASLPWETVDWSPFAFVGVDAYLNERIADRYLEMLGPAFAVGKPVVVTEFGFEAYRGGPMSSGFLGPAGLKPSAVDPKSQLLHQLPLLGRRVRPRLRVPLVRDEAYQAERLVAQLELLERAGVDGAFVSQFEAQLYPYDPDPRFDVDRASSGLVRYLERGRGTTYPDLPWEPRAAFGAVAEFYRTH
jgi:hypothetical protein